MKIDIHPKYYPDAKIICACGNEMKTGSTKEKIEVEICGACHPFFTGKEKIIDTAGRVERFKKKISGASGKIVRKKSEKYQKKREEKAKKTAGA